MVGLVVSKDNQEKNPEFIDIATWVYPSFYEGFMQPHEKCHHGFSGLCCMWSTVGA